MSILRHDSHPIVEDAEGAYLTFDPSCRGTIVLTWSKKAIPDAFIYFNPRKPVPNFKYTGNGGRMQLSTNVQLDPPRYFQGICAFLKTLKVSRTGDSFIVSRLPGMSYDSVLIELTW
uniref:Immune mapped protein 2 N-terminal domain-containing protein n=1 Tax=Toxoplasma gondii (strain ATCC 50861 / VEG) TaxID=432359 RepID=A0A0F7V1W8_TOXGV|nr:TPA: hypothetical protein BN1205_068045 [Toxoplasma gondii VEG]